MPRACGAFFSSAIRYGVVDGTGGVALSFLPCFFFFMSLLPVFDDSFVGVAVAGSIVGVAGALSAGIDMVSLAGAVCVVGDGVAGVAGVACCGALCADAMPAEASSVAVTTKREVRFMRCLMMRRGRLDRNCDAQLRTLTAR